MVFKINGASMEPQIHHGDIFLIEKQITWGGLDVNICTVRYETGITLKRIHFDEAHKGVALQPLSKDFRMGFIDADQSRWLTMIGPLALHLRLY